MKMDTKQENVLRVLLIAKVVLIMLHHAIHALGNMEKY